MPIVDSQVDIWGADTPQRPWPKRAEPQRPVPLGKDELLREMDGAGVDRVVIVPPSWEGDRNDLAIEAALAHPQRFATMGRLDPQDPRSRGQIATWRKQPGMLGLRFTFHIPVLVSLISEGHMDWVWAEAEKAGVPIYVLVPHALVLDRRGGAAAPRAEARDGPSCTVQQQEGCGGIRRVRQVAGDCQAPERGGQR
jgi:predicted TIM-barrel fold metal-dependent hydrolase